MNAISFNKILNVVAKVNPFLVRSVSNVPKTVRGNISDQQNADETLSNRVFSLSKENQSVMKDKFGRVHDYLRISLTEKCNLRCQYCMPSEGVTLTPKVDLLTPDEIIMLARLFVCKLGVTKIRLTGGEPLLQPELNKIIGGLNDLRASGLQSIGMTSNGISLKPRLAQLQQSGLDRLNISLDTLREEKYSFITRRKGIKMVWSSIHEAIRLKMFPLKINCVVMRGLNDEEVVDFVELTRYYPVDVRFIEYMPFSGNKWKYGKLVPMAESLDTIQAHFRNVSRVENHATDTAKSYKVDGFCGSFGFISSMTNHFCSGCNRLRLTADGHLKVCLFDTNEVSIRDVIRNTQLRGQISRSKEIEKTISRDLESSVGLKDGLIEKKVKEVVMEAVGKKFFSHGGRTEEIAVGKLAQGNRSMILIGG